MNALVIGRGSMGRRRIRDLEALGHRVQSWDERDGFGFPPLALTEHGDLEALVVCTPPLTKLPYVELAARWRVPCFTEADLAPIGLPHYPSATPLFTSWYALLRRLLDGEIDHVSAYTLHVGQHLADWHPGADLATYYAARRETGACREMVAFELIWLTMLFGSVSEAHALHAQTADVAEIDDVYQIVLGHRSGTLGHILIDALSRPAQRRVTLVTNGWSSGPMELAYDERDYLEEMRAFAETVERGREWPYSRRQEAPILATLATLGISPTSSSVVALTS